MDVADANELLVEWGHALGACNRPFHRQAACEPWANRVMIRLWRETLAQLWPCWPVKAAVSYSHNGMHTGDLYRFDGWARWKTDAGSSGGGTWGRVRSNTDAVYGKKTLWGWRYP